MQERSIRTFDLQCFPCFLHFTSTITRISPLLTKTYLRNAQFTHHPQNSPQQRNLTSNPDMSRNYRRPNSGCYPHEHKCVRCGELYTHDHRYFNPNHRQFAYQCPNRRCDWYYKRGDRKERDNPTLAMMCMLSEYREKVKRKKDEERKEVEEKRGKDAKSDGKQLGYSGSKEGERKKEDHRDKYKDRRRHVKYSERSDKDKR